MEIKTSEEIQNQGCLKYNPNKKWVGVDDVLKIFEDDSITSFEDLKDYIQSEFKKGD